jgi:hypothetical protein
VTLFWLLDRTGALVDTSLFAAVLVAVGYERILSGDDQTLRAPGEVSQFWTPFLAMADNVAKRVRSSGPDKGLIDVMKDGDVERAAAQQLTDLLRRPGLAMDRVDLILQTLLESWGQPRRNGKLPALLVDSLHTGSVDARTRINEVLKAMASACAPRFTDASPP